MRIRRLTTGFSLVEVLITLAILILVSAVTFFAFSRFKEHQSLAAGTDIVVSTLKRARSRTLASENKRRFGVYFASSSVTMFPGDTYVAGSASNTVATITPPARISSIDLDDGSSQVVFERLTGDASAAGRVTLSLSTDPSSSSTVTITGTGIVEVDD